MLDLLLEVLLSCLPHTKVPRNYLIITTGNCSYLKYVLRCTKSKYIIYMP